jgi:hypothetical protein
MGDKKYMKTLRIYGDSFASADENSFLVSAGWGNMLGELMNIPVQNNAVSGSSTEYSIQTFIKDVSTGVINDNDIIIFVPSSIGRLYFSHQLQKRPETASLYLSDPKDYGESHDWYYRNKDHIEWWMVNNDRAMHGITFESYIQLLKNFAISKPLCTVIVLPTFDNGYYTQDIFNNVPPRNFLRANIFLKHISEAEVICDNNQFDYIWWREFTIIDPRSNHLTNTNLSILANLLVNSINSLSIDNITYDKFKSKNINKITTKEQYLKYITDGLLSPRKYTRILDDLK